MRSLMAAPIAAALFVSGAAFAAGGGFVRLTVLPNGTIQPTTGPTG